MEKSTSLDWREGGVEIFPHPPLPYVHGDRHCCYFQIVPRTILREISPRTDGPARINELAGGSFPAINELAKTKGLPIAEDGSEALTKDSPHNDPWTSFNRAFPSLRHLGVIVICHRVLCRL
ncbi:hypothetical protein CEXT_448111 [Caerostris extrusa]|uniref:Uncharacterized protein n=1 Tax=Caerostris extrusa TaxID=172846 RepID=A0AAV4XS75_CAEEX|nr:hypothetical protein CEXT_448111 [Caerostris extrusa]